MTQRPLPQSVVFPVSLAVAALMLATALCAVAEHPLVVGSSGRIPAAGLQFKTGHRGAITHLLPWAGGAFLVSAGTDGTLRLWEPIDGELQRTVQLAEGNISTMVLHPWLPHAFAVANDEVDGLRLVGWNWQQEQQLFSVDIGERPLFLGLSRTADSLLVGRASFDGLWLLDADTGERRSASDRGHGIVTFAATSRDEQTVLTYQPSGTLTYRSATEGVQRNLSVPSELDDLGLSGDRRYLIGRIGEWLVSVDTVSGVETDRRRVKGLRLMKIWAEEDRVLVVADGQHSLELRVLPHDAGRFGDPILTHRVTDIPTALGNGRAEIFVGLADGTILKLDLRRPDTGLTVFTRDRQLSIIDVAVTGDTIALGTESGAIAITADFVAGGPLWLSAGVRTDIKAHVFPRPLGMDAVGRTRVTALDDDRVLVWSETEPGIALLELDKAQIGQPQLPLTAPIANVNVVGETIAAVDQGGKAVLLASRTGPFVVNMPQQAGTSPPLITVFETLFSTTIPGTADAVSGERAGTLTLIAARNSFGAFGTPIMSISTETGETVAVHDSRNFVYDLVYDPRSRMLYSLGVQAGSISRTSLKRHTGSRLEHHRTLFEVPAEDLYASVAVDAVTGKVYSSIGGRVRMWDGRHIRALAATGREARQIAVHGGRVYAVNSDGTLSIWSAYSLAHQVDLYLWKDFEWLMTSSERYWTSEDGASYVRH